VLPAGIDIARRPSGDRKMARGRPSGGRMPKPKKAPAVCVGCSGRVSDSGDEQLYVFQGEYWHHDCGRFEVCSHCSEPVETECAELPTGERICLECCDRLDGSGAQSPEVWEEEPMVWESRHD